MLPVSCSLIILLYLYVSIANAESEPYRSCGNSGLLKSFQLSPCHDKICTFKPGDNATVTLQFQAGVNSTSLKTEVYGIVGGVPIPFPLPGENACVACGVKCPIQSGSTYKYNKTFPVLKNYPSIRLTVQWKLVGDGHVDVACVDFPIAIVH